MTIAPTKGKKLQTVLMFAIVTCAFFLVQSLDKWSCIITLFFLVPFSICIRQWIATGRTFSFTSEGISINFMWYTLSFPWDEITYAGIFNCEDYFEYGCMYDKGIEFCVNRRKRPHWMGVGLYAILFHPMEYIYIYFGPQTEISKRNGYPPEYEVDEAVFLQLLQKWNVQINWKHPSVQ